MSEDIARLLSESRAAHDRKKRAAGTIDAKATPTTPDYSQAESHIATALRLRMEAHDLDPTHADPAWEADQRANRGVSHDALIAFYQGYLKAEAQPEPRSIEEIQAAVTAKDVPASDAFALLLLENGWIQPSDLSKELQESGPFMRLCTGRV